MDNPSHELEQYLQNAVLASVRNAPLVPPEEQARVAHIASLLLRAAAVRPVSIDLARVAICEGLDVSQAQDLLIDHLGRPASPNPEAPVPTPA